MPEGCARRKALGQCAAHEQIARIGDQCDDSHFQIGRIGHDDGKCSVLACRSVVQQADQKALKRGKACPAGRNAQREGNSKIAQRNGNAIPHALTENFFAESPNRPFCIDKLRGKELTFGIHLCFLLLSYFKHRFLLYSPAHREGRAFSLSFRHKRKTPPEKAAFFVDLCARHQKMHRLRQDLRTGFQPICRQDLCR